MATARFRKSPFRFHEGPFNGLKLFMTTGTNSTVTFGIGKVYGRYILSGGDMWWQEIAHVEPATPAKRRRKVDRVLNTILGR